MRYEATRWDEGHLKPKCLIYCVKRELNRTLVGRAKTM